MPILPTRVTRRLEPSSGQSVHRDPGGDAPPQLVLTEMLDIMCDVPNHGFSHESSPTWPAKSRAGIVVWSESIRLLADNGAGPHKNKIGTKRYLLLTCC